MRQTQAGHERGRGRSKRPRALRIGVVGVLGAAAIAPCHASFLSGEALDTFADYLSWAVLVLVPAIAITVFWIVHVLPEKIAHRRHHPQTQAIQTLCLLSLVFGGLLWPIAWLWAYTKPVAYKVAYGTDRHDDYFDEAAVKAGKGELVDAEIERLRDELDAMQARGALPARWAKLREDLDALRARPAEEAVELRPVAEPLEDRRSA